MRHRAASFRAAPIAADVRDAERADGQLTRTIRHGRIRHFPGGGYSGGAADLDEPVANREAMGRAFTRLSPEHRIVIVLRYYLDLTVDQIAERVGVPAGTVKSRLHHAIGELRIELEQPPPEVRS